MIRLLYAGIVLAVSACAHPPSLVESRDTAEFAPAHIHDTIRSAAPDQLCRLLDAGADPDARDPETGHTPLMTALLAERHDQFRLLLRSGANPALTDRVGNTALHIAGQVNEPWLVLELLEHGAQRATRNDQGKTFDTYLFMTPEHLLTAENKKGNRRVREWLSNHNAQ